MADEEEKKYTPLPPFDITYGEQFLLYDNMGYVCDTDRCNAGMVKMESGNVCKFYRCKTDEPVKIGGDTGMGAKELPEKNKPSEDEFTDEEFADEEFTEDDYPEDASSEFEEDPGQQ